jgi:hypothetical protein
MRSDTARRSGACGRSRRGSRPGAETVRRDLQVGVALVVAEQDVVARLERLDQVVLEQQRLGLGTHHGGLHAHDLRDHVADAGAAVALLEIVGNPLLQVARLAHVEHRARRVEIAVDTRQLRQGRDFAEELIGMRFGHGGYCGAHHAGRRPPSRKPRRGWNEMCSCSGTGARSARVFFSKTIRETLHEKNPCARVVGTDAPRVLIDPGRLRRRRIAQRSARQRHAAGHHRRDQRGQPARTTAGGGQRLPHQWHDLVGRGRLRRRGRPRCT